jgi:hypothetical protein
MQRACLLRTIRVGRNYSTAFPPYTLLFQSSIGPCILSRLRSALPPHTPGRNKNSTRCSHLSASPRTLASRRMLDTSSGVRPNGFFAPGCRCTLLSLTARLHATMLSSTGRRCASSSTRLCHSQRPHLPRRRRNRQKRKANRWPAAAGLRRQPR